jgi:NAD-dependent SIR2 family protein deacetylase
MKMIKFPNKKVTFESFLCGTPARDYINQNTDYDEQIKQAANMIKEADYVLLGAGAGMSTAAGAQYGGKFFEENFGEFQQKYGKGQYMSDMYSAGFYPFPDEESYWGYWSKQALLGGIDLDVTPLHKLLLDALADKKVFLLSTIADKQFEKAGLPTEQIFCTQGDYFHIQCRKGCHDKTYDAVSLFRQMDRERKNCMIPHALVPICPVCGSYMDMNLRKDNHFVQDEEWYEAETRFGEFLSEAVDKKLVLIELGVGFNTPTIIRFPFEKLAREHDNVNLVRLNLDQAIVPESLGDRAVGINADMAKSIKDIVKFVTTYADIHNK